MNSDFMHESALALAAMAGTEPDEKSGIRTLFRQILGRDPNPRESERALTYLEGSSFEQFAQVLLATNEEIFWP